MIKKKLTINYEETKELLLLQDSLNDVDYKIYLGFINKYYCPKFYELLIQDIKTTTSELFKSFHLDYSEYIDEKTNYLCYDIYKFNNNAIINGKLESNLITEIIIFNKLLNQLLSINLNEIFKSVIKELKTLFVNSKTDFMKTLKSTDEITSEFLFGSLLIYLFDYQAIEIEKDIINENNN